MVRRYNMDTVEIRGEVVCKGRGNVTGRAKWISSPEELGKLCRGDILVCDMTGPDWVEAFDHVGAVITRGGGRSCHAAIIAAQMGVLCVVGAANAMKLAGKDVMIDIATGIITTMEDTAEGHSAAWDAAIAAGRNVHASDHPRDLWARFGQEED
jgi:pyruvate, water dikinase